MTYKKKTPEHSGARKELPFPGRDNQALSNGEGKRKGGGGDRDRIAAGREGKKGRTPAVFVRKAKGGKRCALASHKKDHRITCKKRKKNRPEIMSQKIGGMSPNREKKGEADFSRKYGCSKAQKRVSASCRRGVERKLFGERRGVSGACEIQGGRKIATERNRLREWSPREKGRE